MAAPAAGYGHGFLGAPQLHADSIPPPDLHPALPTSNQQKCDAMMAVSLVFLLPALLFSIIYSRRHKLVHKRGLSLSRLTTEAASIRLFDEQQRFFGEVNDFGRH